MKKIVVIVSLVLQIVGQYRALDCLRIERATVWSGSSFDMVNQVGGYTVTMAWSRPAIGIVDHVMSLTEFKMSYNLCVFLSYDVSLTHTTTQGVINLIPHNSKIFSLVFTIALITSDCSKDFQVLKVKYPMTYLNQPASLRTNGIEQNIYFNITKFNFSIHTLVVAPFLTAINITQSCFMGIATYHLEYDYLVNSSNQTHFSIVVRTWRFTFRIDHLTFNILICSKRTTLPNLVFYNSYTGVTLQNHSVIPNYNVPNQFYNQGFEDKCITRTWRFVYSVSIPSPQLKYVRVGKNITDIRGNGVDFVLLQTYCFMQCEQTYYNTYTNGYTCVAYTNYIKNCIAYTTTRRCTACRTGFALVSPTFCSECNGRGRRVSGGCTTMIGCIAVQRLNPSSIYPTDCLACDSPQFYLDSNGICKCTDGQIVTQLCINCYGCISTQKISGKTVCMACDVTVNFTLVGDLCQCKIGFRQTQFGTCIPKCGDGLFFYTEECDDGNADAQDGCYGCKIQPFFKCENGSETQPSLCRFIGKISITYEWADKIQNENRGVLSFKVSPTLLLFTKMNLNKFFFFASPANHSIPLWTYTDSRFQMEVDFQTDLEETIANFTFSFDPTLFIQKNMSQTIEVKSRGVKLRIVKGLKTAKMLSETIQGITIVAFLVVMVGSAARKMIGVEALQLYQIIFFVHLATNEYTEFYSKFRMFGCLSGNPFFYFNHFSSFPFYQPLNNIPFDPTNTKYSVFFHCSVLLLSLILTAAISLMAFLYPLNNALSKAKTFFFEHILFLIAFGSWFPATIYACTLSLNKLDSSLEGDKILIFCILLLCVSVSLIIFYEWKHLFVRSETLQKQNNKHHSFIYVPVFLSFTFTQLFLMVCTLVKINIFLQESVSVCALAMLIWQLKASPYTRRIHNAGIFFNKLTIAFFCVWSVFRDKISFLRQEEYEVLAAFLFVLLLSVCLILAIVRTILSIKQDCLSELNSVLIAKKGEQQQRNAKVDENVNKLADYMIEGNLFSFYKQKKEELLGLYQDENQRRLTIHTNQIYRQKYVQGKLERIRMKNRIDKKQQNQFLNTLVFANKENK